MTDAAGRAGLQPPGFLRTAPVRNNPWPIQGLPPQPLQLASVLVSRAECSCVATRRRTLVIRCCWRILVSILMSLGSCYCTLHSGLSLCTLASRKLRYFTPGNAWPDPALSQAGVVWAPSALHYWVQWLFQPFSPCCSKDCAYISHLTASIGIHASVATTRVLIR
ncbi:hypothetical protein BDW22DRAFT_1046105 [Trametopsis cervina]|nr:hypothetical protein BDW22DRAFT_1046105 [Trametopsis cervina]